MKDIQSKKDNRGLGIKEVGVSDVFLPIFVSDKKNGKQQVVAKIKMSTNLPADVRGTHMSRFLEAIRAYESHGFNISSVDELLQHIKSVLETSEANIEIAFPYFIEKTAPISQKKFLMGYQCKIIGKTFKNNKIVKKLEVCVPISSLCPCSKEISRNGAHNQRGLVVMNVITSDFIWLEDLIEIAEREASGILYPILKRPDEKYVTEKMFDSAKFVEDIVRDVALSLNRDKRVADFFVKCTNYESIHNHNSYAKITKQK